MPDNDLTTENGGVEAEPISDMPPPPTADEVRMIRDLPRRVRRLETVLAKFNPALAAELAAELPDDAPPGDDA